ncbi:hypothetical protein HN748_00685 [Candidatus Peregrinibacteria bacterium]|jgi:hypothetical protein|nr:hypothetical protein [Candidatus Peregrinibacteria bacterium]MBT7702726.1 hypothetical protein [Candidatus Peregrinibacteria bacterium]
MTTATKAAAKKPISSKKPVAKPAAKKTIPFKKPGPTGLPEGVVFYCKDCNKMVPVHRVGRRYVYTCADCGTKNVAFGTEKSIKSFFHIKEVEEEEEIKEEEVKEEEKKESK